MSVDFVYGVVFVFWALGLLLAILLGLGYLIRFVCFVIDDAQDDIQKTKRVK